MFSPEILEPLDDLLDCTCCPRRCHAARNSGKLGYCRSGAAFSISSILPHRGEEPVLSGARGICNVFFEHCNMQCVYCQNYQISYNRWHQPSYDLDLSEVVRRIETILDTGVRNVGFVSPSHFIPQMRVIMRALDARGRMPIYVFNTNAYDNRETIESLEGLVHVYLPDLKYMDDDLACRFSDAPDYSAIATVAIKEMYRQTGANLMVGDDGIAESGLIIRHLVLPGQVQNSKRCLRFIAEELSTAVHISLMAQYYPTPRVAGYPGLDRPLETAEYEEVVEEFYRLGFWRGWVQELESQRSYRPDFNEPDVFRM